MLKSGCPTLLIKKIIFSLSLKSWKQRTRNNFLHQQPSSQQNTHNHLKRDYKLSLTAPAYFAPMTPTGKMIQKVFFFSPDGFRPPYSFPHKRLHCQTNLPIHILALTSSSSFAPLHPFHRTHGFRESNCGFYSE